MQPKLLNTIIVLILIQVLLFTNCVLALNQEPRSTNTCLSPEITLNLPLFIDDFTLAQGLSIEQNLKNTFFTFHDYMQQALHNQTWGYYGAGKVNFQKSGDFFTDPVMLSPYYGQMVAELAFKMWQGMRQAKTLADYELFSILELGGGDGTLAFDTLEYIKNKSKSDLQWYLFWQQLDYVLGDASTPLRARQIEKNQIFKDKFKSIDIDAEHLDSYFPENSVKGLIFSNELPDAFAAHKIRVYKDGTIKAAIAIPAVKKFDSVRAMGEAERKEIDIDRLNKEDKILRKVFGLDDNRLLYLSKRSFLQIKDKYSAYDKFAARMMFDQNLVFTERYVSTDSIPGLSEFIKVNSYQMQSAVSAAAHREYETAYINIKAANFIKAAGKILNKGYCVTVDFGERTDKAINTPDSLRCYKRHFTTYNPYKFPGNQDIMTIVDFTRLHLAGESVDLKTLFFGRAGSLKFATGVRFDRDKIKDNMLNLGIKRSNAEETAEIAVYNFENSRFQLNMILQQKKGTDPDYQFISDPFLRQQTSRKLFSDNFIEGAI